MDVRKKILLRQMNKSFDNDQDINDIKKVFTIFTISVVFGFLLTLIISSVIIPSTKGHDVDHDYLQDMSHKHRDQSRDVADSLFNKVRILCLVTTYANHQSKAKSIQETWGSRCNKIIFVSPKSIDFLEVLTIPGAKEGRSNVWHGIRESLKHIYEKYSNKFDYVVKTDDNTYVIMENLRYLLERESPDELKVYGFKYKDEGLTYLSSIQIMSREVVKKFVEKALPDGEICKDGEVWDFDKELGKCLINIGVEFGETLDFEGKERIFPFSPSHHMFPETMVPGKNVTYVTRAVRRSDGLGSLSDYAVSFHSLVEQQLILFEYLIYHLRPYGIVYRYEEE